MNPKFILQTYMSETLQKEEVFHDDWANSVNIDEVMVDEFFEACTSPENRYIISALADVRGKKVVELGCGLGEAAVYFAKKGADVIATDISSGMLKVVEEVAKKHRVSVKTVQAYSHQMPFPDNHFDIVYAANLLHHVDVEQSVKEACRILKSGGSFVSWDPLAHNPAINVYRKKAMSVRTEDEHPLKMNQLKIFKKYFSEVKFETTWFFSLWIFIKFYFFDHIDPNKERYWKKILVDHKKLEKTYARLEKNDKIFLKIFPFLRRYCWNIVIVAKK